MYPIRNITELQWSSPIESDLYYLNSRYYNPELCRFISPDSIKYFEPESINGLNLYSYANNNPIGIAYRSSSVGGHIVGSKVRMLVSVGVISGESSFVGSNGLSIKFSSQNWLSLGIDLTASMSGALSVLRWNLKNLEFYRFWYTAYGISRYEILLVKCPDLLLEQQLVWLLVLLLTVFFIQKLMANQLLVILKMELKGS